MFYNRGIAYQTQGSWQAAIDDFSQALTLDEEDAADILFRRGSCYEQLGQTAQAQQDLETYRAYGQLDPSISQLDPSIT